MGLPPDHSADARRILRAALDRFPGRIVLASSLGPQSVVILDLLDQIGILDQSRSSGRSPAGVPVVFLDTGLHFRQTLELRARIQERFGIQIQVIRPARSVEQQAQDEGAALWERDPDRCCALRKVEPLRRALAGQEAWIAGLRRSHGPARAQVQEIGWDPVHRLFKVCPLVHWSREQVLSWVAARDLPVNPLLADGYPSVGCQPCTSRPGDDADPTDERAGRWRGRAKTECGIHGRPEGPWVPASPSPSSPSSSPPSSSPLDSLIPLPRAPRSGRS